MCGIFGKIDFNNHSLSMDTERVQESLYHRGPDDKGVFRSDGVVIGHTRLSIIDLSIGGKQPMSDSSGRYTITFNGEIYNFKDIKNLLPHYPYKSQSDTEVILAAYIEWGEDCLNYMKGQFAFAIWDNIDKCLFIARDRLGEKPFYYFLTEDTFVFASEMRALLATGIVPKSISRAGLAAYLKYQSTQSPDTIIENVYQLPPAHFGLLKNHKLKLHRYYDITAFSEDVNTYHYTRITKDINTLLTSAVEGQMVSDVPLGAFLSGGIDSSAIVGLMAKCTELPVNTLSVTFDEKKFDESPFSSLIAKRFNTKHTEVKLSSTGFLDQIDDYFNDLDTPSSDGPNTWIVSKATKQQGLTVALSGLGGDELFAGYTSFRRFYSLQKVKHLWSITGSLKQNLIPLIQWISSGNSKKIEELFALETLNPEDIYSLFRQCYSDNEISSLLKEEKYPNSVVRSIASYTAFNTLPVLSQYSVMELTNYTRNVLLKDADSLAMAHSLEIRVPFFDHDLIKYVLSVPDKFKYPHTPKKLLVDSLNDLLPEEIINRPKMGFSFPWDEWLRNNLQELCQKSIFDFSNRGIVNRDALLNLWSRFNKGEKEITWNKIWLFVVLENWLKTIKY